MQCNHTFPIISNFLIFLSSLSPLFCLMIYALLYFHPTKYFLILITKKSYIFVEILSIIFLQIKKLTIQNYYFLHKKNRENEFSLFSNPINYPLSSVFLFPLLKHNIFRINPHLYSKSFLCFPSNIR